ncbi:MAG TPA: hypothetical protein VJ717_03330 [Gemmatimonadaceae bacterium]|nr:hypothetical protein [Gemmatimonadaceae bacterium]
MIGRFARQSMLALTLALLAGCGDDDSTGPDEGIAGVYTLLTINGQQLPVVVQQQGSDRAEITQGSVTINENGTFTDVTQVRFTISGQVSNDTETASGTWTRTGSTLQFSPTSPSGSTPYTMTWDGDDRLTQVFQGFTLVYER